MDTNKVYPSRNNSIKRPIDEAEDNPFQEVMAIFESISALRIIEKITKPGSRKGKEEALEDFAKHFVELEQKLMKIQNDLTERLLESVRDSTHKGKSLSAASITHQLPDWKKAIRTIENKYYEVFDN